MNSHSREATGPPGNDDGPGTDSEAITATAAKRIDTSDGTGSPPKPLLLIDSLRAALTDIGEDAARAA